MNSNEISISEIVNSILASNTLKGNTVVFLPVKNKNKNKVYDRLISEVSKEFGKEQKRVLLVTEKNNLPIEDSILEICDIDKFLKYNFEEKVSDYDMVLILSPRFNNSPASQTLVRKGKNVILIIEEFLSKEGDLTDDLKEINNLGAEVLGAIYVEA
ncbi:hypothetical protein [Enterococcus gilvus]|uniref:hypothetical protein n=1 Tax=Enterococcus gilvus TaxID=160453 RepID=UPI00345E12EC